MRPRSTKKNQIQNVTDPFKYSVNWKDALFNPPSANAPAYRIFENVEIRFNKKLVFKVYRSEKEYESNIKSMDGLIRAMDNKLYTRILKNIQSNYENKLNVNDFFIDFEKRKYKIKKTGEGAEFRRRQKLLFDDLRSRLRAAFVGNEFKSLQKINAVNHPPSNKKAENDEIELTQNRSNKNEDDHYQLIDDEPIPTNTPQRILQDVLCKYDVNQHLVMRMQQLRDECNDKITRDLNMILLKNNNALQDDMDVLKADIVIKGRDLKDCKYEIKELKLLINELRDKLDCARFDLYNTTKKLKRN